MVAIGLKDLLGGFYLLGDPPEVTLFAVSIVPFPGHALGLSSQLAVRAPEIAGQLHAVICSLVPGEVA